MTSQTSSCSIVTCTSHSTSTSVRQIPSQGRVPSAAALMTSDGHPRFISSVTPTPTHGMSAAKRCESIDTGCTNGGSRWRGASVRSRTSFAAAAALACASRASATFSTSDAFAAALTAVVADAVAATPHVSPPDLPLLLQPFLPPQSLPLLPTSPMQLRPVLVVLPLPLHSPQPLLALLLPPPLRPLLERPRSRHRPQSPLPLPPLLPLWRTPPLPLLLQPPPLSPLSSVLSRAARPCCRCCHCCRCCRLIPIITHVD